MQVSVQDAGEGALVLKERYEQLQGARDFTTFHQSFSYEDFVRHQARLLKELWNIS